MWEHFKDQTFCHALRRRPDSLLLSAMRGSSLRWRGCAGTQTDTVWYSPLAPSAGMHVSGLRHVPLALKGMRSQWGHWFGLAHTWGE